MITQSSTVVTINTSEQRRANNTVLMNMANPKGYNQHMRSPKKQEEAWRNSPSGKVHYAKKAKKSMQLGLRRGKRLLKKSSELDA